MRTQISVAAWVCMLLAGISTAWGQSTGEPQIWKDLESKKIYYAPRFLLSVKLNHIGADDEYWDQLSVEFGYDHRLADLDAKVLSQKYPEFELNRTVIEKNLNAKLKISALGIEQDLWTSPGQEGPYGTWLKYISKADSTRVRQAIKADPSGFAAIQVSALTYVPVIQVVESVELPESVCNEWVSGATRFSDLVMRFPRVKRRAEETSAQFSSTRLNAESSVFESCLDLDSGSSVRSFEEFSEMPVKLKAEISRPRGETKRVVIGSEVVWVRFQIRTQIEGVSL